MFENKKNNLLFKYGKRDYTKAKMAAKKCLEFRLDRDEDELVTSVEDNSCYNCLYRKWTNDSFLCMRDFSNAV